MDTQHTESKINTYEVYCKSFSRIIQCINAFSAVIEFQKDHPLEEIISIENVKYRATPVSRTADDIIIPVPGQEDGNFRDGKEIKTWMDGWENGYIEGRTQPEEREERVRAHSETWDAAMDYVKEREDYQYGKRGGFVVPNKEQYIASIK